MYSVKRATQVYLNKRPNGKNGPKNKEQHASCKIYNKAEILCTHSNVLLKFGPHNLIQHTFIS